MSEELMTLDEAIPALLAYVFTGAIGSPEGKGVGYALIRATPTSFCWSAALEDIDGHATSIYRYLIQIDRRSKEILPPEPIVLSEAELAEAVLAATGQHLASSTRFIDGALSISYNVNVQEKKDLAYVVQLRHHGQVASRDALMTLISRTTDCHILPVPPVYPIPGELERQEATGIMASSVFPGLPHEKKLVFVRNMALAFQTCWGVQLPEHHLIGELSADRIRGRVALKIGLDRHYELGGKQQGIDDYKELFLDRIRDFVSYQLHNIPAIVEDISVVAMHADTGPHNVIVSSEAPTKIQAVIDWEFVASAPYASLYRIIEMLFRTSAPNGFGLEYEGADELREAFWSSTPYWKQWHQSETTQAFMEWFRFALFMKPEWRPKGLPEDERRGYSRENIAVVEDILNKYSCPRST